MFFSKKVTDLDTLEAYKELTCYKANCQKKMKYLYFCPILPKKVMGLNDKFGYKQGYYAKCEDFDCCGEYCCEHYMD